MVISMQELLIPILEKTRLEELKKFYINSTDSTVWSCLQGYNGRIFVNDGENMSITLLWVGDFLFPSCNQEFDEQKAMDMLMDFNQISEIKNLLIIPQTNQWEALLQKEANVKTILRYAIKKKQVQDFDKEHLESIVNRLGEEYHFKKIDKNLAEMIMNEDWSRDFCSNFNSPKDYEDRGFGVVILRGEEIVCGASSYTAYDKGIEVEIATKEAYKRRGLATICGAKLILLCMQEGLQVNWDAANLYSVKIAETLGFEFDREYATYLWNEV